MNERCERLAPYSIEYLPPRLIHNARVECDRYRSPAAFRKYRKCRKAFCYSCAGGTPRKSRDSLWKTRWETDRGRKTSGKWFAVFSTGLESDRPLKSTGTRSWDTGTVAKTDPSGRMEERRPFLSRRSRTIRQRFSPLGIPGEKVGEMFNPRCVKFLYAPRIFRRCPRLQQPRVSTATRRSMLRSFSEAAVHSELIEIYVLITYE